MGLILLAGMAGCGDTSEKQDIDRPADFASLVVAVPDNQPGLMILVSYLSTPYGYGNLHSRLKLVNDADFNANAGSYQFLGRAFAAANGGFSAPAYEYFQPIGYCPTVGFHYRWYSAFPTAGQCPSWVPNGSSIFYSAGFEDVGRGVVTLYQYASAGGSSGSGNVAFTINPAVIEGLRASGIPVEVKPIGYIYHGIQADCDANRSPYCGQYPWY